MGFQLDADRIIGTIIKHDAKITTYKFALLRAINDIVVAFPDVPDLGRDVAIPLRMIAQYWVAYYWPFMDSEHPIYQGQRAKLKDTLRNDMAFRPVLTALRSEWETTIGGSTKPADGFFLINELRLERRRESYPSSLFRSFRKAVTKISYTVQMPIRYAGPAGEEWAVFHPPRRLNEMKREVTAIPGTRPADKCVMVSASLWQAFKKLSMWIEALCIHEWCLFSENIEQTETKDVDRGDVYVLLTDRPDNRRPLTWERNAVDLLLMEGIRFICPWTAKPIKDGIDYDLDHLVPISLYPTNELWNLVPSDPYFNSHKKRDRLPSSGKLAEAQPHLELAYRNYTSQPDLSQALRDDVAGRFVTVNHNAQETFPSSVAHAVVELIEQMSMSRNVARF